MAYRSLTSAGRKNHWLQYPDEAPSQEEIDALVKDKLLKRSRNGATSITTAGKNAADS